MKKYLKEIFIDGLSGMATGLFATLIIGTIIVQIGALLPQPLQDAAPRWRRSAQLHWTICHQS